MRVLVWATFCDIKFKAYLVSILVNKYKKLDRNINIFLAFAASGSVASWAIWQEYKVIWSSIIVISQVIQVLKPYFPYYKFVNELNMKSFQIENLVVMFEKLWYDFNSGNIDENQASKDYFRLKLESAELLKFDDDLILSPSKSDEYKASERMQNFLRTNYAINIEIEEHVKK